MFSGRTKTQFNCFSPPVMIATMVVETTLIVYTFWRYKLDHITRLAIILLTCLATFQLAEYFVCTGYGTRAEEWSRLGFVMITTLPPIGVHLMHKLADKPIGKLVYGSYALMGSFMIFFLTYHAAFIGHQCTGNYVIFQMGERVGGSYSVYYYGLLALGIGLGIKWAEELKNKGEVVRHKLESVRALIIGYLIFLVPTALANSIKPETRRGIPSIMCGFAVLFALILTLYIVPRMAEDKITTDKKFIKA